jgi:hypothetical protein
MHTFMTLHGGYEFAGQIEGKKVRTGAALRTDATTIDKVLPGRVPGLCSRCRLAARTRIGRMDSGH